MNNLFPIVPTFGELKAAIWDILKDRVGINKAITRSNILEKLWWRFGEDTVHERRVRQAIKSLVEDDLKKIAASTAPPYGYFIPETVEEMTHYINARKSRIRSEARFLRVFEQVTGDRILELLGQGVLTEGEL